MIAGEPGIDRLPSGRYRWRLRVDGVCRSGSALTLAAAVEARRCAAIDVENAALTHRVSVLERRLAEVERRLEVRIGELLGPAIPNGGNSRNGSGATDPNPIPRDDRSDFRNMAEHRDVVEEAIAASTDDNPPSRRSVRNVVLGKVPREPARRRRGGPQPYSGPRYSLDEVIAKNGVSGLARIVGVSRAMIHGWIRAGGVDENTADRVAIALGEHPATIWPEWMP